MQPDPGYVYVASNGRWAKIGKTRQRPRVRIEQLNRPDSPYAPFGPWFYVAHIRSPNHSAHEAAAHRRLNGKRVRAGACMEIFAVSSERACEVIGTVVRGNGGMEAARFLAFLIGALFAVFAIMVIKEML